MFSQTVEYALRAVVYLANDPLSPKSTDQIAIATDVPRAYLSKVLQGMVKTGIINSQRGVGGGMSLVKSPDDISILEVVNAVDPIARIHECPLNIPTHGTTLCALHKRMDEAMGMVEDALASSTLADILSNPTDSLPLCEFPGKFGKNGNYIQ